jgi:hypothetical protein
MCAGAVPWRCHRSLIADALLVRGIEAREIHGSGATPLRDDCHLRSGNAVLGHHIEVTDGDVSHLEDLLIDDYTWAIRYLIVDTSDWCGPRAG